MTKSESTRLWNHLMRMGDKEFEQLFAHARNQRVINKYYNNAMLRELKQESVFTKLCPKIPFKS